MGPDEMCLRVLREVEMKLLGCYPSYWESHDSPVKFTVIGKGEK